MRMTQILMNKPFYLGFSILDPSKTLMCEIWYDYVKPEYGENVQLKVIGLIEDELGGQIKN